MQQQTVGEGFRLSHQQRRLWKLQQESSAYRVQCTLLMEGSLKRDALQEALQNIVDRHEILRTAFRFLPSMDMPVQMIVEDSTIALQELDLQQWGEEERNRRLEEYLRKERQKAFDYEQGKVVNARVVALTADKHLLVLNSSALCMDEASLSTFVGELVEQYGACVEGNSRVRETVQYVDFSEWQYELLESEEETTGREFWEQEELSAPPPLRLPGESGDSHDFALYRPESITVTVEAGVARSLEALATAQTTTTATVLLACWQSLLWRLTGEPEIMVLVPGAFDRVKYDDLHESLGLFTKYLPLRCQFEEDASFRDAIRSADTVSRNAHEWQEYYAPRVPHDPPLNNEESTLHNVGFEFQSGEQKYRSAGLTFTRVNTHNRTEYFKLQLSAKPVAETLRLTFHYDASIFDASTVERLSAQYLTLLHAAAGAPDQPLSRLELLGAAERQQLLVEWRGVETPFPADHCLHQLIEAQVERTPHHTAVIYEDDGVSYAELNRRANQLAHHLRQGGVGPDVLVGILMERSVETVVALLGVLKAGGAYLPLDPAYPHERLRFMLEDAAVAVLLTQQSLVGTLPPLPARLIPLDAEWDSISQQSEENPCNIATPDDLAYVIYTSGSTGRPKGVLIEHRSVLNLLTALEQTIYSHHPEAARVSLNAPLSFDASVKQVIELAQGRTLVIVPERVRRDGAALREYITLRRIDVLDCTPAQLRLLAMSGGGGETEWPRVALVGGEAIDEGLWRELASDPTTTYYNLYGPTECTVDATCSRIEGGARRPTLGRALPNMEIRILDARQQLVPIGVAGELCIGGAGVGRGYLRRDELTREKFIAHPSGTTAAARVYRTGDMGRYLANGEIEYVGRIDRQVKLRGYRVELGEIEAVIGQHPEVRECAVVAREDEPGDRRLVAYVVPRRGRGGQATAAAAADIATAAGVRAAPLDLREYVRRQLPDYMLPTAYVEMSRLPLTRHGKVDHAALPGPEQVEVAAGRKAKPRTPVEEMLVGVWKEVLRVKEVGIDENFFEMGGHSLLATQLASRAREVFGVEVALRKLFERPTVAGLAAHVEEMLGKAEGVAAPPIVRVSRDEPLPLSFAQQRLWFIDQLEPGSAFYNSPAAVRLSGVLNVEAAERTLSEVVRRHEVLRTHFVEVAGEPVQIISPSTALPLPVINLSELDEAEREIETTRLAAEEARTAFDLSVAPLIRAKLLRLSAEEHVVLLTMHHIVNDGWSIGVLVKELSALYEAYSRGEQSPLAELGVQYADYAVWQREWLRGEVLERQLAYWREQLAGAPAALELPADHQRPATQSYRGAGVRMRLSEEQTRAVKELSRREGVTPFMTLLGAYQVLLMRYTGQEDVVVGTPIAGRNRGESEGLVGLFLNALALRTKLTGNPSFREVLGRVRDVTLGAYAHQELPFEKLVEELRPQRDLRYQPIFQVMLILQNAPQGALRLDGLELELMASQSRTSKYDLSLYLTETAQGEIAGWFEYNTDLFEEATVERMASHFSNLLSAACASPHTNVARLSMLSADERRRLLTDFNETSAPYPADRCLHQLFEQQAARTPHSVAVISADEELSYAQLEKRANQLSRYLRRRGVRAETRVGICVERGVEMIVGVLGILKAGGAYVPLDPEYPRERVRYMMEDSGVRILLTQQRIVEGMGDWWGGVEVVELDGEWGEIGRESEQGVESGVGAENLAYVIYTSGSTGQPKGVLGVHRAPINRFAWMWRQYPFEEGEVSSQKTSLNFVDSLWEIFGSLLAGVPTVLISNEILSDPVRFGRTLTKHRVTRVFLVPSLLRVIVEGAEEPARQFGSVKYWAPGGEALEAGLRERFRERMGGAVLLNLYGTSEVWDATYYEAQGEGHEWRVPIGRPISNVAAYILDGEMNPVPIGVSGELYIGGDGLARGYLDRPGLTAERFVPHPFTHRHGARLYRTGDLARYLVSGEIEYLGRLDHQVKVRGFRIELGEIETAMTTHSSIAECVVAAREDAGTDKRLVAYVVVAEGQTLATRELREHLRQRLPEYMIPSAFVELAEMPLTPSGKVDRRSLPAPEMDETADRDGCKAARNPVEEVLAGLWAEVLRVKAVGVEDNFFEMGGHSLLATQLMSRVREAFRVEVALRKIFEEPTVAGLAAHIEALMKDADGIAAPPMVRASREKHLPLSFAQQRLWFLDYLEPANPFYNIPAAVRLSGALDVEALERALTEVVRRHEVLRTYFAEVDAAPVQIISAAAPLPLPLTDLSELEEGERETEVRRLTSEEARTAFNLGVAPLIRARLLRLSEAEHVVLLTLHHIITDGWSIGIFIKEVAALYEAFTQGKASPLAELEVQYADYAAWQRGWLQGDVLERQLSYWRRQLGGRLRALELPTDRPRPAVQSYRGRSTSFGIRPEIAAGIRELSRREGVTLFMTLLAAFKVLLHRYTKQDDILVGSAIAGRNRGETEPLIGFFINTLVLRTDLSGEPRFRELLRRVREVALGAYAHQDVPFEKLVEELQPERSLSHTPLFQVTFGVQNTPTTALELPGLRLSSAGGTNEVGRFDLTVWVVEAGGSMQVRWGYNTDLFDGRRIEQMQQHYETLLESIVAEPDARLTMLNILTSAEREEQVTKERALEKSAYEKLMNVKLKPVSLSKPELTSTRSDLTGN